MNENGYIKLHRKILKWGWYSDINTRLIFLHLLVCANWEESEFCGTPIKRGQLATTVPDLAKQNHLTVGQVRTALSHLKATNEITIESTTKFSIITLNNYTLYQSGDTSNDKPTANQQQTNNKPITNEQQTYFIKKENKNIRKQESKNMPARESIEKRKFAEFVSMTNDEYSSLVTKLGEQGAKRCIEILDNYKGAKGVTYKSDYRAILNWVITRYNEERPKSPENESPSFDTNDIMSKIKQRYEKGAQ